MKRNTWNKLLVAIMLLAMISCKARKQVLVRRVETPVAKPVDKALSPKQIKLNAITASQTIFNTFSGKARTKLDINGSSNDVTLNIRINRGNKIWVSITAIAGIEVARALITPDSIMIINRLQSVYIKKPFSYIYTYASKQVNYNMLEALLIGNASPQFINENGDMQIAADGGATISGNLQGLVYNLIFRPDSKVVQLNLNNQLASQSLQVTNKAFTTVGNRVMPSQIDMVSIVKDKKIQVNLHYVKSDFDQRLDYPFSIPGRYSPAD